MGGRAVVSRFVCNNRGNTAVLFGLTLPMLIGFVALGGETGYWYWKHRQLQEAADIASHAGAVRLRDTGNDDIAEDTAESDALLHGYDPATMSIDINTPPSSGAYQNNRSVEVEITHNQPRFFSAILSSGPVVMRVRAVSTYVEYATACVLALHKEAEAAVEVTGSADVELEGCTVQSNSIDDDSIEIDGSSSLISPCVSAVGGIQVDSDLTLTDCNEVKEWAPAVLDPFGNVPEPAVTGSCKNVPNGNGNKTLQPGRYCNGFNMGNNNVTLEPGVYIIDGGTFRMNSGAHVQGTGVTFFLTGNVDLQFNGNAEMHLTAPTSGTYKGLLFFGDRDNPDVLHKFNGTADSSLIGALYFSSQRLEMLGNFGGSNGCTQIIAQTIKFSGSLDFSADCSGAGLEDISIGGMVQVVE
jgi:Flp pilus assembly protein TadG